MLKPLAPVGVAGATRRHFVKQLGALCGLASLSLAAPVLARTHERRAVSFVHTHTGEKLTAHYFAGGCYQPHCLQQVDHLLRDFRTGEVHPIDPALLDILYDLQVASDRDAPFEIICGYRSPATNELLRRTSDGVAEHSLHLVGQAIDVRLNGFATHKLYSLARELKRGGAGFYASSDFVHIDTGRVRYW